MDPFKNFCPSLRLCAHTPEPRSLTEKIATSGGEDKFELRYIPQMLMIIRGVTGVLLGILYGLLVYVVVYPLTHIGLDYEHPGPLIPNTVEWANLATIFSAWVAGISASLVGLMVGLVGTSRKTAAIVGFIIGLILLPLFYLPLPEQLVASPSLRSMLGVLLGLVLFPFALAIMSVLVASIGIQLKRWGM